MRAFAALGTDADAVCAVRLARVAGTHALLLDGLELPPPQLPGVGRWTVLRPVAGRNEWSGPLRTATAELPFEDDSFCAVLVRFAPAAALTGGALASELARVLAPHGSVLVTDLHPRSLWHAGSAPRGWERALSAAGLRVSPRLRCGSPWPRVRGAQGLPHWLVRTFGGAWVVEAQRPASAAIPLRRSKPARRVVERQPALPGARRECA